MGSVRCHSSPGHRSYTFQLFVETLCEQLVGTVQNKNRAFGLRTSMAASNGKHFKLDVHHDVEKPLHATSNQRCRVCQE